MKNDQTQKQGNARRFQFYKINFFLYLKLINDAIIWNLE